MKIELSKVGQARTVIGEEEYTQFQFISEDEARAWDQYVSACMAFPERCTFESACLGADALLRYRRDRSQKMVRDRYISESGGLAKRRDG